MTYTRWSDQFLQCGPLRTVCLLLAANIVFRKCGSFPHLQNYCYILIQYERVCWVLLDMTRKGAIVEALQGKRSFSWFFGVCKTALYYNVY